MTMTEKALLENELVGIITEKFDEYLKKTNIFVKIDAGMTKIEIREMFENLYRLGFVDGMDHYVKKDAEFWWRKVCIVGVFAVVAGFVGATISSLVLTFGN
jgi:hypothetical protein